jgi:hypothetical protein
MNTNQNQWRLAKLGGTEQCLNQQKDKLLKSGIRKDVREAAVTAWRELYYALVDEWTGTRNDLVLVDLLDKYTMVNHLVEQDLESPNPETVALIKSTLRPEQVQTKTFSLLEILGYKTGAGITRLCNQVDKALSNKYKPYTSLTFEDAELVLKAIKPYCTAEKQNKIDDFLGGR